MTSRGFVITVNNWEHGKDEFVSQLRIKSAVGNSITYCKVAAEVGASGTPHLQGYIEFARPRSLRPLMPWFKWHIEIRKGSAEQADKYCDKEDPNPSVWGERTAQGQRSDIANAYAMIKAGSTWAEILEHDPSVYVKYFRGLKSARFELKLSKGIRDVEVSVYWGPSGTGKTYKAVTDNPGCFILADEWFDGYAGEGTLIIDEFYGWLKWSTLLRILEGYPYQAAVKGTKVVANWTKVIITSNKPPDEWYPNQHNQAALMRRIKHVVHMVEPVGPPPSAAAADNGQ